MQMDRQTDRYIKTAGTDEMRITNVFSANLSLSSMSLISENSPAKRVCVNGFRRVTSPDKDIKEDSMCWVCHTTGYLVCCDHCPRVYHLECLGRASKSHDKTPWMCPVCQVRLAS